MKSFLTVLTCVVGFVSGAQAQAVSYSHPDNLIVTNRLGCITAGQVKNTYTPADLAQAVVKCAKRGKYDQALQLFFLYSVYGHFDQKRMKDRTATAAIGALNASIFNKLNAR